MSSPTILSKTLARTALVAIAAGLIWVGCSRDQAGPTQEPGPWSPPHTSRYTRPVRLPPRPR